MEKINSKITINTFFYIYSFEPHTIKIIEPHTQICSRSHRPLHLTSPEQLHHYISPYYKEIVTPSPHLAPE